MQVVPDIRAVSPAEVDRVLGEFVSRVGGLPGVVAVFRFGSLSHPGISDLDVLVVVRDDVDAQTLLGIVSATQETDLGRYLFTHPPFVIPESQAPKVRWVHTLYGLQKVWGHPVDLPPPPAPAVRWLQLAEYVDFTFTVRSVLRSWESDRTGLRGLLLLLTSCLHSLRLSSELLGQPLPPDTDDRVRGLREAAQAAAPDPGAVAAAWEVVVCSLQNADRALAELLTDNGVIASRPLRECLPWADGRYYVFQQPYPDRHTPPPAGGCWRRLGVDPRAEVYPAFYLAQFSTYGRSPGPLGRVHRLLFGVGGARLVRHPTYRAVLHERISVAERIYQVTARGGVPLMVPLGIGFRDPERIRPSRRRRWLRHLVLHQASRSRR